MFLSTGYLDKHAKHKITWPLRLSTCYEPETHAGGIDPWKKQVALVYFKREGIVEKGTILNPENEDILQTPRFQVAMEI